MSVLLIILLLGLCGELFTQYANKNDGFWWLVSAYRIGVLFVLVGFALKLNNHVKYLNELNHIQNHRVELLDEVADLYASWGAVQNNDSLNIDINDKEFQLDSLENMYESCERY